MQAPRETSSLKSCSGTLHLVQKAALTLSISNGSVIRHSFELGPPYAAFVRDEASQIRYGPH